MGRVSIQKVLVADAVDSSCVQLLQKYGIQVDCKYKLSASQLMAEISQYDALIVRSDTKVTAQIINAAGDNFKVIGRAGVGVDNIDVEAASARGIIVLNAPTGNSISACELTCALITNLARNVINASNSLKAGRWDRKLFSGQELSGKTLAIIGLGRVGREVAVRMQAWGMKTIGFDPIVNEADAKSFGVEKMELDQIWPQADYITVHTPLIPATKNLINKECLAKCKNGVRIINVARGGIIDEADLLAALENCKCGGAALDVFEEEPPTSTVTLKLIQHEKLIATPHLGASTTEAQIRVAVEVAEQFLALAGMANDRYTSIHGIVNKHSVVL